MRTLKTILAILLLATALHAAPSISGTSGTFENSETITITGSGFGSKTAAPLISSYDNATSTNNWSGGTLSAPWTIPVGDSMALSNSAPLRSSSHTQSSYKIAYDPYYTGGSDYEMLEYTHMAQDHEVYVSFWMYKDYSAWSIGRSSGSNSKFFRILMGAGGTSNGNFIGSYVTDEGSGYGDLVTVMVGGESDTYSTTIAYSAMSAFQYSSAWYDNRVTKANANLKLQQWEHYEFYFRYPTSPGGHDNTEAIMWIDGRVHSRTENLPVGYTIYSSDRRVFRFGLISGNRASGAGTHEYIDQIYIDNTPARVIISSASDLDETWPDIATVHHSEVQVCSSWSASEIQFTLNQGTFGDTDTAYLYVVDSTGAISPAYEITLSGEGGGEPAPAPPTLSNVTISGGSFR